jgi:hypothetical protein
LRYSGADTRRACELRTLNLWQSHADPDSYAYCYAYADSNAYCYSHSYAYTDGYANCHGNGYAYTDSYANVDAYGPAESKPDTKATSDPAAAAIVILAIVL